MVYRFCLVIVFFLAGCATPIGVNKVTPKESYQIATANALSYEGKVSNNTKAVLQRFNLLDVYDLNPQQAISNLHQIALIDESRDLLFSLAEISYAHAELLPENSSDQNTSERAQDVFLQAAVYAIYIYWARVISLHQVLMITNSEKLVKSTTEHWHKVSRMLTVKALHLPIVSVS